MIGWSDLGPGVLARARRVPRRRAPPSTSWSTRRWWRRTSSTSHRPCPTRSNCIDHRAPGRPWTRGRSWPWRPRAGSTRSIVLGYRDPVPDERGRCPHHADPAHARQGVQPAPPTRPRVVAEMLDRANVAVAQTTGVEDFIVSDELSSLMIAQLSERLELHKVFDELFDADGCFVALHPAPHVRAGHAGAVRRDRGGRVGSAARPRWAGASMPPARSWSTRPRSARSSSASSIRSWSSAPADQRCRAGLPIRIGCRRTWRRRWPWPGSRPSSRASTAAGTRCGRR